MSKEEVLATSCLSNYVDITENRPETEYATALSKVLFGFHLALAGATPAYRRIDAMTL